jgi:hypothetical protein
MLGGCSLIVDDPSETSGPTDTGDETQSSPGTGDTDPVSTGQTTDETDPVSTGQTTDPIEPDDTDTVQIESFQINSGAPFTTKLAVQLVSKVSNANAMRMRNTDGKWSPWIAYKDVQAWSLNPPEGERAVEAEFRYSLESPTKVVKDTITLDMSAPASPDVRLIGPYFTSNQTPSFELVSNGGGNGTFRVKVDNADLSMNAQVTTNTPWTSPRLMEGWHHVYVQERDEAGNWSESGIAEVHVDFTKPVISAFVMRQDPSGPDCTYTSGGIVQLHLEVADEGGAPLAGVHLRNETTDWVEYSPHQPIFAWELPPGWGRTFVHVEIWDEANNLQSATLAVYREDIYEQCLGNDTFDSAWVVERELGQNFDGVILEKGPAMLVESADFYKINVPEGQGGTLEIRQVIRVEPGIEVSVWDKNRNFIETASGSSSVTIFLGGRTKTPGTIGPQNYCQDSITEYYIKVVTLAVSMGPQQYDVFFEPSPAACQ